MCPHNTIQPNVRQYRKRSPDPYFRLNDQGTTNKELCVNEPNLGWPTHLAESYIEESTCVSQPMIGISADVLMGAGGKPACCSLPRRQPLRFGSPVSCTWMVWPARLE